MKAPSEQAVYQQPSKVSLIFDLERFTNFIPSVAPPLAVTLFGWRATSGGESSLTAALRSDWRFHPGFRNFIPKHAFTRYCWLTTDSLVKRDHGPPAGALRAFTLHVGLFATPWLHPKGG